MEITWERALVAETETKSTFEPGEAEDRRLDAEAMVAYRAGRFVPHAEVAKWLASWGTPEELDCPKPEPH
jgi:predicted transcriptional regulator